MKSENFSQCEQNSAHNVGNKSKRRRLLMSLALGMPSNIQTYFINIQMNSLSIFAKVDISNGNGQTQVVQF